MANEFKIKHGFISTGDGSVEGSLTITGAAYADNGSRIASRPWVTQFLSDNSYATSSDITTAISNLVDSAPGTLDTLNELAAAIGDDASFSTTITNSISTKLPLAGGTMTGNIRWTSSEQGLEWVMNTDGAGIKFYNTSDGDTNSRLEYYTTDNGNEFHRFMVSGDEEMTIKTDGVRVNTDLYISGNRVATQSWVSTRGFGYTTDIDAVNTRIDDEILPLIDDKADASSLDNYLPLAGGTLTGDLQLGANQLLFDQNNVAAPSTTNQHAGTRILLYPSTTGQHYAIGIEASNMWFNSDGGYNWYNETNNIASLSSSGVLYVNSGNSAQWNTAYGWGDHGSAGYLTSNPNLNEVLAEGDSSNGTITIYHSDHAFTFQTDQNWGGWARTPFRFRDGDGNNFGGLGAYGGNGTTLSKYFIGAAYNDNLTEFHSNGEVNIGSGLWVNGNNDTVYNNYNENLRLPPAGNGASVIAFRASGNGGVSSSSILGYSDRHEVRINSSWKQRIYNGNVDYSVQLNVSGHGNSSQWNTAYGWGDHGLAGYLTTIPGEYLTQTEGDARYDVIGAADAVNTRIDEEILPAIPTVPTNVSDFTNDAGYITDGNTNWNNSYGFITSSSSISGTSAGVVKTVSGTSSAELVRGNMGDNDQARILVGASASNAGYLEIATADDGTEPIYVRQYSGVFSTLQRTVTLLDGSGNTSFPNTVTAPTFSGALSGNANTATRLATARNIALSGAVTGSANFDGSGNITIAATATSDPTLTLSGDASGSATFTNLGNATLTVTVANDSHTHDGRYYTESESDARFVNVTGDTVTGDLAISGATLSVTSTAEGTEAFFVDGVNGRLFTISDDLSDSLFSANTISGLPVIEAFADNTVKLGPYSNPVVIDSSGNLNIGGTSAATESYVDTAISDLIGGAPGALNTLNELAAAINDNASYASSVTTALGLKAPVASPALTGNPTAPTQATSNNSTRIATTAFVKAQGYVTTDTNTNYYLDGITKSGNTLTYVMNGKTDVTYAFGSNAFTSYGNHVGLYDAAGSADTVNTRIEEEVLPSIQTPAITSNGSTPSLNSGITAGEIRTLIGAQAAGSYLTSYTETDTLASVTSRGNTTTGSISVNGNILLTGTATSANQARTIEFTGFDKEGTTDFSDRAYIAHTTATGGHAGSVLVISSQNDSGDGIAFLTNASSKLKHNSNNIATESWVTSQGYITSAGANYYVDGLSFDTGNGVLTASLNGTTNQTVDLDGRYYLEGSNAVSSSKLVSGGNISTQPGTNNLLYTGQLSSNVTGLFPASDNSNSIITLNRHSGNYDSQLGFSSNGNIYYRKFSNSTAFTTQPWNQVWHSGNFANNSSNWNTAHGWGNHASAGYLTSFDITTQTDSKYVRSDVYDTTYSGLQVHRDIGTENGSWTDGEHTLGLENSDAGNIVINFHRAGHTSHNLRYNGSQFRFDDDLESTGVITSNEGNSDNWNTAFSWGNHSGLYLGATAKAADSNLLDGLDSSVFLRSNANDTATGTISFNAGINTLSINDTSGQQLVICAGEAGIDGSQTGELVYVNAENGFQVAASNDNWASGYAGTKKTIIDYGGIRYDGNYVWHAGNFNPGSYQAAGTYNTIIGTDSDINTSGSTIIDNIYVTDGVITSMGTRTLTQADLGIPANTVGNWWNGGYVPVGTDGVTEVGKYIDFHDTDAGTTDFSYRITNTGDRLYFGGDIEVDGGDLYLNNASTRLHEGNGDMLRVTTASGYIEIGPANTSHCHIQTDRSNFYFNTQIQVDTGIITSYNEDLQLQRQGSTRLTLGSSVATFSVPVNMPQPAPPVFGAANIVGETIEVVFDQSPTGGVDYYQVWSSVAGGAFGMITQVPTQDIAATMTAIDADFAMSGAHEYRIYAIKNGIYSDPAEGGVTFNSATLDVTNLSVVNLNTAYYIQYNLPNSRFVDHIEIYMDAEESSGSISRSGATLVYSGNNSSYMYQIGASDLNKFHQFWVEVIES